MSRTPPILLFCSLLLCSLAPLSGSDAVDALRSQRNELRQRLAERLQADADKEAPRSYRLTIDKGPGRKKRPVVLLLRRIGGLWGQPQFLEFEGDVPPQVDISGLRLEDDRLLGDLVMRWANEDAEELDAEAEQRYAIDAAVVARPERLVLTLHRFLVGDDWLLSYQQVDSAWQLDEQMGIPHQLDSWGPFKFNFPPLQPATDGSVANRIDLTYIGRAAPEEKDRHRDAYQGNQPRIDLRFRLVDGQAVDGNWTRQAAGGKHLLGTGTDLVTGSLQNQAIDGSYHAIGNKGEWTGSIAGPVIPTPVSVDLGEPADDAGIAERAAEYYHQIRTYSQVLARYPAPLRLTYDQLVTPTPAVTADDAGQTFAAALRVRVEGLAQERQPLLQASQRPEARRFGPYHACAPLPAGNSLAAVDAAAPQNWHSLGEWQYCGPFRLGDDRVAISQPGVLPVAAVGYHRTRLFSSDSEVEERSDVAAWRPAVMERGLIAVPREAEADSGALRFFDWYATTTIDSAIDQRVHLALRPIGQAELWLDEILVWSSGYHYDDLHPTIIPVDLHAGSNRLLLRLATNPFSMSRFKQVDYFEGYGQQSNGRIDHLTCEVFVCSAGSPATADANAAGQAEALPGPEQSTGRLDQRGLAPTATPPLAWDLESNKNIAWRTPLPHGSADAVLRGDALFVVAEPHHLICLDAAEGSERWRQAVDIFPTIDAAFTDDIYSRYLAAKAAVQDAHWTAKSSDDANDRAAAEGMNDQFEQEWAGFEKRIKDLGYGRGEHATAAPVVTDEAVFVHFGTGVIARFDHVGQEVWRQATGRVWSQANMGDLLLAGGKLIAQYHIGTGKNPDEAFAVAAFDPTSGKRLWEATVEARRTQSVKARPASLGNGIAAMRLTNGEHERHVLITGEGVVLDADDGAILLRRIYTTPVIRTPPLVIDDTVYLSEVIGNEAVRLWLDQRGRVCSRLLWAGYHRCGRGQIKTITQWANKHWMKRPVLHDGLLFSVRVDNGHVPQHAPIPWTETTIVDAATGERQKRIRGILRETTDPTVPPIIAGKYLTVADGGDPLPGFGGKSGAGQVVMLETRGSDSLPIANSRLGQFRATPIADGERLYFRCYDEMICCAVTDAAGEAYQLEAKAQMLFDRIPDREAPVPMLRLQPEPGLATDGTPVWRLRPRQVSNSWLVLGPVPLAAEAEAATAIGGEPTARPRPDQTITIAGTDYAFTAVPERFIAADKRGATHKLNVTGPIDGKQNFVAYYYTVIDNPEVQVVRFRGLNKGVEAWFGGQPVGENTVMKLDLGPYPLLIKVRVGRRPPFMQKALHIDPQFSPDKDPNEGYGDWAELLRTNQHRFQEIIDGIPDSGWAGKARIYLKQLEHYDSQR